MYKNILLVSIFTLLCSFPSYADTAKKINEALDSWQPLNVSIDDKQKVAVVLNERKITNTIYDAIIHYGFCLSVFQEPQKWKNININEIKVLNKFSAQGYVFEGGVEECQEMGNLKGDKPKYYILGRTHLY